MPTNGDDPFAGLDYPPPVNECKDETDGAAPHRAVSYSRRRRKLPKREPDPWFTPGDKPRNNFARSWLAFNFALDELLGLEPGDLGRWHNQGFRDGPTRRFLEELGARR